MGCALATWWVIRLTVLWWSLFTPIAALMDAMEGCKLPSKFDAVIGYSPVYGNLQKDDVVWHNEEWAYRMYGPISRFTLFKAWYYDGVWHDPGELKGLQTWYGFGVEQYTHPDRLLLGARRPHVGQNFSLYREEVLVRAELEWDDIMHWANFTSSLGRYFAWGFPNASATVKKVAVQPPPGAYIAAFRGYEGKPLPPSLGGFQKRYISQLGFVWAMRNCAATGAVVAENSKAALPRSSSSSGGGSGTATVGGTAAQRRPHAAAPTAAHAKAAGSVVPATNGPTAAASVARAATPAPAPAATKQAAPATVKPAAGKSTSAASAAHATTPAAVAPAATTRGTAAIEKPATGKRAAAAIAAPAPTPAAAPAASTKTTAAAKKPVTGQPAATAAASAARSTTTSPAAAPAATTTSAAVTMKPAPGKPAATAVAAHATKPAAAAAAPAVGSSARSNQLAVQATVTATPAASNQPGDRA